MYPTVPPTPPTPLPVRRTSNSNCMVWGLGGCGVVAVILVIAVVISTMKTMSGNKGFGGVVRSSLNATACSQRMKSIRTALQNYRQEHGGSYPSALKELVPHYLRDSSDLACGGPLDTAGYHAPRPTDPATTPVYTVHTGQSELGIQSQEYYVRLRKDDSIVMVLVQTQILVPSPDG